MRIGYYQSNPEFGETSANLERISAQLDAIEADLIVLPELCVSGYQFVSQSEVRNLAESIPDGPTTARLIEIARKKHMVIVAGLAERAGSLLYNSAVAVGPTGFIGAYRKTHLFSEETLFFTPGDTGFRVWDIGPARIGVMICFDWYYPESARALALRGADIICHPSNLVLPNCPDSMPVRCLENRVFSVTCNRTGMESRGGKAPLVYIGNSEIVNPRGEILCRSPRDREDVCIIEIDPSEARDKAVTPYNDLLRDRRDSLYQ
ncbi:putative N-carbamoyl-D-amino acid hydrolase [Nitrospira japonica]|uniref:Putative N-carbamoyl-D-amino acid hydrolase n=1 Tax=Nitrospira japonica TaxID=1325564 RepID=A0A1W1HZU0_9BACT|nr:nitrilase-related carbon-nitrogen hydrolase [Nitrospira japonica]SLM46254.1 putative N-carbamoyl-D-amino acid hydrolase [Nitrospira japonica]